MTNTWLGIFWKVISCACFACSNGIVRYLSGGSPLLLGSSLPIYAIMFYQNLIGVIILGTIFLNNKKSFYTENLILHSFRVFTAVFGIGLWYLSMRHMPMVQAVALSFLAPFLSILGAVVLLKEQLTWQKAIAILLSMLGGFLITKPDWLVLKSINYFNWVIFFPLLASLIFALDKVITRKLMASGESPFSMTFYLLLTTVLFCTIPMMHYGWIVPGLEHWPWLLLMGIFGLGAHFSFSKAFAFADVTFLLPFGITKFIFCGVVGYFAFTEYPKTFEMWIGAVVIVVSTLILGYRRSVSL